jgi:hypothetical protein
MLSVLVGTKVFAQSEQAEALIREATELRRQKHDERALPLYEKAYSLSRTPRTAAQLGLVEMALGYWIDSEKYLTEALASPDHPWIAKNFSALRGALATVEAKIGQVVVTGTPPGASVSVNGKVVGTLPTAGPVRLDAGQAEVVVKTVGYVSVSRTLTIVGAETNRVAVDLIPEAQGGATNGSGPVKAIDAPNPSEAPKPAEPISPRTGMGPLPGPESSSRDGAIKLFAWASGIGAGGALVLGIVETVVAVQKKNAFESHIAVGSGTPGRPDCQTSNLTGDCKTISQDHDRALKLAIAGYAMAGALTAVSTLLFIKARESAQSAPSGATAATASLSCSPGLSLLPGLLCQVSF